MSTTEEAVDTVEVDGFDPSQIVFGRHIEHDERSRAFAVSRTTPVASVLWPRYAPILDQGRIGSCTGNAMTGWLACAPHCATTAAAARYTEEYAVALYSRATRLDNVPGSYPPSDTGSTGLAVAKAARQLGEIRSYGHVFTTSALLSALQHSPVIIGSVWTDGMFSPDAQGFVHPNGSIAGGHEWLVRGLHYGVTADDQYLIADNSWGSSFGMAGSFRVRLADWETLRSQQADVVVPVV